MQLHPKAARKCVLPDGFQATTLLSMNKHSVKDAKDIQNSCFQLNSLQLRALLTGHRCADDEPRIAPVSAAGSPPPLRRSGDPG